MAHSVVLTWTASVDVVDGYNVYRGSATGQENTKLNTAIIAADTFTDNAPPEGESFYIVKSSLGGVESVPSTEVNAVILPFPPTNVKVASVS